jgi:transcriptional regulator
MYIPASFQGPDQTAVFEFIEAHSFGILVSGQNAELCGTHLPLLLRRDVGPHGQLVGHMARANSHWRSLAGAEVLIVFPGPHTYISPSWYQDTEVVPTWNYLAVHAAGRCEIIDDEQVTRQIVANYVEYYERSQPQPWRLESTAEYVTKLLKQIVAFHIDIARLEAKWKLSQNHSVERREKVVQQLAHSSDPEAREIGRLMHEKLNR